MTCDEFERILEYSICGKGSDGWLLRVTRGALAEAHLQSCPACASRMMAETRLENALRDLRLSTLERTAPPAVEKNLLNAFERECARRASPVRSELRPRLIWAAAAALVLIAAGWLFSAKVRRISGGTALVTKGKQEETLRSQPAHSAPPVRPAEASPQNQDVAKVNSVKASDAGTVARRGIHRAAVGDEFAWNGGGNVVRVRLPLSSLTALGLPVRDNLSDPQVTADVWVDPFGEVMRVRLVAENRDSD
jgi:hypothetical protein